MNTITAMLMALIYNFGNMFGLYTMGAIVAFGEIFNLL